MSSLPGKSSSKSASCVTTRTLPKCITFKGYEGAVLMALSKAFDNLNHDLLIAMVTVCYGMRMVLT